MKRKTVRIQYVIPYPFGERGIEKRAQQIRMAGLKESTVVECVPVRGSGVVMDSQYEAMLFDMYIVEAALRAEEDGMDAVVMDTVSDSGLACLRSRLTIPVIGPGLASYAVAMLLGKRFAILTVSEKWRHIYERNLDTYRLWSHCAAIRVAHIPLDFELLFEEKGQEAFEALTAEAQRAIVEDRADVIVLGSTTLHEAGEYIQGQLGVPVINPGPAALRLAEACVDLRLTHSKLVFGAPSVIQDEKFAALLSEGAP